MLSNLDHIELLVEQLAVQRDAARAELHALRLELIAERDAAQHTRADADRLRARLAAIDAETQT